jgi:hypothetical protein
MSINDFFDTTAIHRAVTSATATPVVSILTRASRYFGYSSGAA